MQWNNLAELALSENVSTTTVMGSEVALVHAVQSARGEEPCYLTEKRLLCSFNRCEWRSDCCRLIAAWKR